MVSISKKAAAATMKAEAELLKQMQQTEAYIGDEVIFCLDHWRVWTSMKRTSARELISWWSGRTLHCCAGGEIHDQRRAATW